MQIYRLSNSTPQVYRINKTIPINITTRNMAFYPRFFAHEFAPALRESTNLFRLLDDYAGLIAGRSNACGPSFTQSVRTFQPRFDVKESKDSYELHGELPGIAQKDINIEFTDATTLSIRGRTETVREEGRRPTAAVEAQPEQQKLADADAAEWESVSSSTNYHKASVEDEEAATTTTDATTAGTPAETPSASVAPSQSQEVAQNEQQSEGSNYWLSERSVGSFARSFSFPQRVDQEAVKASLKDGILSIVVPKAQAPANRRINIE
jgi:HSP20 family protein